MRGGAKDGRGRRRSVATAALAVIALAACSAGPAPRALDEGELRADAEFVGTSELVIDPRTQARNVALSHLGAALTASAPGENMVVSPVSVLLAFAMLREGATGQTADELDAMFAFDP